MDSTHMSNTFTRAYTNIVHTYVLGLNNHDWAVWKAAHACLNADPHGALNTDDLEIAIRTAYPNQHFVRNTLQQNISKSPDFQQYAPPGVRRGFWHLTGSETGVPKPIPRTARHSLQRINERTSRPTIRSPPSNLMSEASTPTISQESALTPPSIPVRSRPAGSWMSIRGTEREVPPTPRYSSRPSPYCYPSPWSFLSSKENSIQMTNHTIPQETIVEKLPSSSMVSSNESKSFPSSAGEADSANNRPRSTGPEHRLDRLESQYTDEVNTVFSDLSYDSPSSPQGLHYSGETSDTGVKRSGHESTEINPQCLDDGEEQGGEEQQPGTGEPIWVQSEPKLALYLTNVKGYSLGMECRLQVSSLPVSLLPFPLEDSSMASRLTNMVIRQTSLGRG